MIFQVLKPLFHTGWFVESLATQTLVLLVIRTAGNPWHSKPSLPLLLSVLSVVTVGALLPFSPLPVLYLAFLVGVAGTYLVLVEWVKRRLL